LNILNYYKFYRGGAPYGAEIIPLEPDPDNAGAGKRFRKNTILSVYCGGKDFFLERRSYDSN